MWLLPAKNAAIGTAARILYANMVISNIWQLKTTLSLSWPVVYSAQEPVESFQSSQWLSYSVNRSLAPVHHVYNLCFCTTWETTNCDDNFPGQVDFCYFFLLFW